MMSRVKRLLVGSEFQTRVTLKTPDRQADRLCLLVPFPLGAVLVRILFDGFWWAAGPYSNRQVLREFVFSWHRVFPDDRLIVAVRSAAVPEARSELPAAIEIVASRLAPQGVSAIVELPFLARRVKADLVISHNFSPLFGPSAVFVHDLLFKTNPEWFTARERLYFSLMTLTLRRANTVITSSLAEAARIDRVGRGLRPAVAVGLGFPAGLITAEPFAPPEIAGTESFILIVGRLNIRKNLGVALQAAVDSGCIGSNHPLVVVGEPSGKGAILPPVVADAVAQGAIRFTGFISDGELAWLYSNAKLFLFLSLDEGFGIPTLEALHFGTPIVASDIAVFREILGNKAHFVDPHSTAAIGEAMRTALTNSRDARPTSVSAHDLGYSWDLSVQRFRGAVTEG